MTRFDSKYSSILFCCTSWITWHSLSCTNFLSALSKKTQSKILDNLDLTLSILTLNLTIFYSIISRLQQKMLKSLKIFFRLILNNDSLLQILSPSYFLCFIVKFLFWIPFCLFRFASFCFFLSVVFLDLFVWMFYS